MIYFGNYGESKILPNELKLGNLFLRSTVEYTSETKYFLVFIPIDNTKRWYDENMALTPDQLAVLVTINDVFGWVSFVLNTAVFIGYS